MAALHLVSYSQQRACSCSLLGSRYNNHTKMEECAEVQDDDTLAISLCYTINKKMMGSMWYIHTNQN